MKQLVEILSIKEAIQKTSLSRTSIYRSIANGEFPTPIRLSKQRIGFLNNEIESWIKVRIHQSRSAHPRPVTTGMNGLVNPNEIINF
jgi:prophage regulatory protein